MKILAEAIGSEVTAKEFLPTLVKLAADPVPNVRFNVAKTFLKIGHALDKRSGKKFLTNGIFFYFSTF